MKEILVGIDVETTGLSAEKENLLEVAMILADTEGNEINGSYYQAVVKYSADETLFMYRNADPYVQQMHERSGLWKRLESGKDLSVIDAEIYQILKKFHIGGDTEGRITGNSLRLDLNFMEKNLPLSYSLVSYRSVDVSALAFVANKWGNVPYYQKKRNHEALSDIKETFEELRHIRKHMFLQ